MSAITITSFVSGSIVSDGNSSNAGTITWSLRNTGNFSKDGFTTVGTSGNSITTNYPTITHVHSLFIGSSNWMAQMGVFTGGSVGLSSSAIPLYQNVGCSMGYLRGNGTNWTLNGDLASVINVSNTISNFFFSPPKLNGSATDIQNSKFWRNATATYTGTVANREVVKIISGLGSSTFGFQLVDSTTGIAVATNSTSDVIEICFNSPSGQQLTANSNNGQGYPGVNVLTTSAVFQLIGFFD